MGGIQEEAEDLKTRTINGGIERHGLEDVPGWRLFGTWPRLYERLRGKRLEALTRLQRL